MKIIHVRQFIYFSLLGLFYSCGTMNANKLTYHKVAKERSDVSALKSQTIIPEEESLKHTELAFISSEGMGGEILASVDNSTIPAFETRVFKKNMERECDVILLRNGEEISAKVKVVGINEIIYEKCEVINGSEYTILKKDVFMITYSNGSKDVFKENAQRAVVEKEPERRIVKHAHAGGVVSLVLGLVALVVGGLLFWPVSALGLPGFILGVVGTTETAKHPEEYTGMGASIVGVILGILAIVLFVIAFIILV